MTADLALLPRFIRAKQAPAYLGMCRAVFDAEVRPHVREFPIGKQGVGFDRFELDAWADAYHIVELSTGVTKGFRWTWKEAVNYAQVDAPSPRPVPFP